MPYLNTFSWEPDCTALALAYEHSIELCRTTPRFEQYATLSLSDSTAAIWQSQQLYVVTPAKVFAVFTDPGQAFVQVRVVIWKMLIVNGRGFVIIVVFEAVLEQQPS